MGFEPETGHLEHNHIRVAWDLPTYSSTHCILYCLNTGLS
jgi:hypothetical protein